MAQSPRRPSTPFSVPSIFSSSDADVLLRSSDQVDFAVHRRILTEASPLFRTMFDLPQPPASFPSTGPPVIDMQEPASTLSPLLTLLYPVPPPPFPTLDAIHPVLLSAHKYDLESVTAHLRHLLVAPRFLQADALAVYALACQTGLHAEAKLASRYTLHTELMALLLPLPNKLGHMLAVDLVQLVALRVARCSRAKQILKSGGALPSFRCACGSYPSWLVEWKKRACLELDRFPVSDTAFSAALLGEVMTLFPPAGFCTKCGNSIEKKFDKQAWNALKAEIDELPDTI